MTATTIIDAGDGDNVGVGDLGSVIRRTPRSTSDPDFGGDDVITTGDGNDVVLGGTGDDVIDAG